MIYNISEYNPRDTPRNATLPLREVTGCYFTKTVPYITSCYVTRTGLYDIPRYLILPSLYNETVRNIAVTILDVTWPCRTRPCNTSNEALLNSTSTTLGIIIPRPDDTVRHPTLHQIRPDQTWTRFSNTLRRFASTALHLSTLHHNVTWRYLTGCYWTFTLQRDSPGRKAPGHCL